jgi:hypothetical protein
MFTRAIFIRLDSELIRESVCACAKLFVDEESTWHLWIGSWTNKHIDGFYTKTTQKGWFSKLCVKIKKICYTDLLHFSTRKHNLVFFSAESYFDSRIASSFFISFFFFQQKTLGDKVISFKLETKIMNFMTVFFFFENNIIKPTQVLSIICNTICLQFSHYQAPLQNLGLFLLITSRISDFKCHSY